MNSGTGERSSPGVRMALLAVAVASLGLLIGLGFGGEIGATVSLLLTPVFPLALIVLGASRRGRLGPLVLPLLVVGLLLEGGLIAMWLLRGKVLAAPWFGGLPLAANVLIYGMWIVPFVIVVVTYALTFDSFTLTEDDLRRLDEMSES